MRPFIKVCGTTSIGDALLAVQAGADYLGLVVEHPASPRSVTLEAAATIAEAVEIPVVAVTVNLQLRQLLQIRERLQTAALQLHGDEPLELVRGLITEGITVWATAPGERATAMQRAADLWDCGVEAVLIDARHLSGSETVYGGTGEVADWALAADLAEQGRRLILAGGLTPGNVAAAVRQVRPWMVDVASGVEAEKGKKDSGRLVEFIRNARGGRQPKMSQSNSNIV